jgi:hypothetical protein
MEPKSSNPALVMAVYAALTYDIISATNSSPQTTEINASVRAETLMKWVNLGLLQAALFAGLGIIIEVKRGNAFWPPLLGSGLAGGLLFWQYEHAKRCGIEKGGPPSEVYGGYG